MDALILSNFSGNAGVQTVKPHYIAKGLKRIALSSTVKLLLVFAVGSIAWISWKPSLYEQYKINNALVVGQLVKSNAEFKTAAEYLDNGDYYEARQILSKHYLKDLGNVNLAKQYAIILIESDCFETSKQVLYPVFDSGNTIHKADAAYLLGLTFLKEGRHSVSQHWLSKVSSSSIYYHQAKDLISKLDGIKAG